MRTHILLALAILVCSSIAAVVAKATWYDRDRVLPWIRTPPPPVQSPVNGSDEAAESKHDQPPALKPGTIVMEEVLEDLASGSAFLIDARESHELEQGYLRGAIHLPSSAIYDNIDNVYAQGVGSDDKIVVYCGGGECEASHNVADALRDDFGFTRVLIYEKGWKEIVESGRFEAYIEWGSEQ